MGATLCGELAGASFRFETDSRELADYAGHHLAPLRVDLQPTPAVTASLRWHEGQPEPRARMASDLNRCSRVDRDLYVGDGCLYWFRVDDLRDLQIRARWHADQLEVEGDFYFRIGNGGWQDRLRKVLSPAQAATLRLRRFTTLLYYLIYYPCWWWLEQMRDLHPVHAAGVQLNDKVILLAGASGVGKSTLAVALAAHPGARFLSDSFVLQSGDDVCAVPEPVLLDAWSRTWLGTAGEQLERVDYPYVLGRSGYQFPRSRTVAGGRAGLLVFPRRAPEPYVRRLSPDQAHQRLSAADMIINDLRRYYAFAAVFEQLAAGGLVAHREANIAKLTTDIPSYDVGLTATATRDGVIESIADLLSGQHLRVVAQRP